LLIIFDLDDTLVDTSGCITPRKLEDALQQMVHAGMQVDSFSEAYELLSRLDETAESSRFSLAEFVEILNIDQKYFEIGLKEIYETPHFDLPIFPTDHAIEVLQELSTSHQLALVTIGIHARQLLKLKKAGIDTTLFSKIVVTEERNKKTHYQAIIDELAVSPSEVVVCGDRIATDLAPAKELGFKTIHMRWGRGLNSYGNKGDVDYAISRLSELREILNLIHLE
jgi:putative hydrolase of the HAD superfamily